MLEMARVMTRWRDDDRGSNEEAKRRNASLLSRSTPRREFDSLRHPSRRSSLLRPKNNAHVSVVHACLDTPPSSPLVLPLPLLHLLSSTSSPPYSPPSPPPYSPPCPTPLRRSAVASRRLPPLAPACPRFLNSTSFRWDGSARFFFFSPSFLFFPSSVRTEIPSSLQTEIPSSVHTEIPSSLRLLLRSILPYDSDAADTLPTACGNLTARPLPARDLPFRIPFYCLKASTLPCLTNFGQAATTRNAFTKRDASS